MSQRIKDFAGIMLAILTLFFSASYLFGKARPKVEEFINKRKTGN